MLNMIEIKVACLRLALDRPKYAGGIKTAEDLVAEARVYELYLMENAAKLPTPVEPEKLKGKKSKTADETILGF